MSKEKFVSSTFADASLNIHDNNFWDKIIPNQISKTELLLEKISSDMQMLLKNTQYQNEFLKEIEAACDDYISKKLEN